MCREAARLVNEAGIELSSAEHVSRPLNRELIDHADLILTADRGHRSAVLALSPRARTTTFTLRQTTYLGPWVTGTSDILRIAAARAAGTDVWLPPGDLRATVPALPVDPAGRLTWLVAEMDAARGLAPRPGTNEADGADEGPAADDIADPHAVGFAEHPRAVDQAVTAAAMIVSVMAEVLSS